MKGEFVVRIGKELKTFSDSDQIPDQFDNIIKFLPEIPPPPHSEQQHLEIESYGKVLQNLISKENKQKWH